MYVFIVISKTFDKKSGKEITAERVTSFCQLKLISQSSLVCLYLALYSCCFHLHISEAICQAADVLKAVGTHGWTGAYPLMSTGGGAQIRHPEPLLQWEQRWSRKQIRPVWFVCQLHV